MEIVDVSELGVSNVMDRFLMVGGVAGLGEGQGVGRAPASCSKILYALLKKKESLVL